MHTSSGVDIGGINRITNLVKNHSTLFLNYYFSPLEINNCKKRGTNDYISTFALNKAVYKTIESRLLQNFTGTL